MSVERYAPAHPEAMRSTSEEHLEQTQPARDPHTFQRLLVGTHSSSAMSGSYHRESAAIRECAATTRQLAVFRPVPSQTDQPSSPDDIRDSSSNNSSTRFVCRADNR